MTGAELKAIRHRLGLSTTALGRAFGYVGVDITASGTIRKYESGVRPIPPWLGRLAIMFDRHGVPEGWTVPGPLVDVVDDMNRLVRQHGSDAEMPTEPTKKGKSK